MATRSMTVSTAIPPSLRPILRAYALGYITVTGPRLINFLAKTLNSLSPHEKQRRLQTGDHRQHRGIRWDQLYTILRTSTELRRFPTSCAVVVCGATLVPGVIVRWLVKRSLWKGVKVESLLARIRLVTTIVAAWVAWGLLNSDEKWEVRRRKELDEQSRLEVGDDEDSWSSLSSTGTAPSMSSRLGGKTLDFTLFALIRAIDAVLIEYTGTRFSKLDKSLPVSYDQCFLDSVYNPTTLFALSTSVIMHTWFYEPTKLPKSYTSWISTAASIDPSLIAALRYCREGKFLYGIDTGQSHLLEPLCKRLNLPLEWADPSITVPIPCELYHSGAGPSCEVHALARFARSFWFALKLYLPLNILSRLLSRVPQSSTSSSDPSSLSAILLMLKSTLRSVMFLSTFITSFYYSVCLARTRLGPRLFSSKSITPQQWDSGLCVLAGCLTCGWSAMIETEMKRWELAFFVLPRAMGSVIPKIYDRRRWGDLERTVFAGSCAIVLNAVQQSRNGKVRVRGVFGRVLEGIMKE